MHSTASLGRVEKTVDPGRLAAEVREILAAEADPETARAAQRFFKPGEEVPTHGIKTPRVRQIERTLHRRVRDVWGIAEALTFCEDLLADPYFEAKAIGLLALSRYAGSSEGGLLRRARRWLEEELCNSWAATDLLAQGVLDPLLTSRPELLGEISAWTSSSNRWTRRACAVALAGAASRGEHLEAAYRVASALSADDDHLVQKAAGWLLREAGVTDPGRLARHLLRQGPAVPRTTVRYAVERFSEGRRAELLRRTRGPRKVPAGEP